MSALLIELRAPPVELTRSMHCPSRDHPLDPVVQNAEANRCRVRLALYDPSATAQATTLSARRFDAVGGRRRTYSVAQQREAKRL